MEGQGVVAVVTIADHAESSSRGEAGGTPLNAAMVRKLVQAHDVNACALARALARAIAENEQFLQKYRDGSLRVPADVKELLRLCKQYRKDALQHQYNGHRLAEYVLELRAAYIARLDAASLPPLPDEISGVLHNVVSL
ncbi:hypothetical protein ACG7TL_002042 [Trametes sanguinea]